MNYGEYKHVLRMLEKGGELEALGFGFEEATGEGAPGQFKVSVPAQYRDLFPKVKICAHFEEAVAFAAGFAAALRLR